MTKYYYDRYWGLFTKTDPRVVEPINDEIVGVGYSGNRDLLNDVTADHLVGRGPLLAGLYTITSTDNEKGPLTHHLTPDPSNQMYGRAEFLIHGDTTALTHTASDGCIAAPEWTREEFKVGDQIQVI